MAKPYDTDGYAEKQIMSLSMSFDDKHVGAIRRALSAQQKAFQLSSRCTRSNEQQSVQCQLLYVNEPRRE
jgi:hypothetical protein